MIINAPRGTQDILPELAQNWRFIENTLSRIAGNFGYGEIRTPVFEHTELFQHGVGDTTDVVQKEMYTFNDKGDRSITLRPEGTASVARAYIEHSLYALPLPVKMFYNISCYRYEKPQAGRLREFHQFGAEAFGCAEPELDIEIILLAHSIFSNLGIKNLALNINSIGCPECRKEYTNALKKYFSAGEDALCETCKTRLNNNPMRILDCKSDACKKIAEGAPIILDYLCDECSEHFEKVKKGLSDLNIDYNINPKIVRGLDYYTRTVFEFISTDIGAQGTVCGGGRYDNLIELIGGKPSPGIGFAMGIERLIMVMNSQGIPSSRQMRPSIYIASAGQTETVQQLTYLLRKNGIYAEHDLMSRSLKAQFKNADRMGAAYSLTIGENEIQNGKASLKNMQSGELTEVSINDLSALCNILKKQD